MPVPSCNVVWATSYTATCSMHARSLASGHEQGQAYLHLLAQAGIASLGLVQRSSSHVHRGPAARTASATVLWWPKISMRICLTTIGRPRRRRWQCPPVAICVQTRAGPLKQSRLLLLVV